MTSRLDDLELELSALADLAPTYISKEQTFGRVTQRRRRRQTARVALGVLCVVGVVSGLVAINRTHRDSTAAGPTGPTTPLRGAEFVAATEPPMVTMTAPGWTVDYFADAPWGQTSIVVVDAVTGFAGGSFVVENVGEAPVPTTVPTGSESNLADEGIDGQITNRTDDSYRSVTWHVGNVQLQASARNLSLTDTLAITRSIAVAADGSLSIGEVPAGLVSLPPPETGNVFRRVEYQWANDDGARSMQLNLYPGGDLGTRIAPNGPNVKLIDLGGHDAFLSEDGMRVDWLDGFWVWEATGQGYADLDSFLADAALVAETDRATWVGNWRATRCCRRSARSRWRRCWPTCRSRRASTSQRWHPQIAHWTTISWWLRSPARCGASGRADGTRRSLPATTRLRTRLLPRLRRAPGGRRCLRSTARVVGRAWCGSTRPVWPTAIGRWSPIRRAASAVRRGDAHVSPARDGCVSPDRVVLRQQWAVGGEGVGDDQPVERASGPVQ